MDKNSLARSIYIQLLDFVNTEMEGEFTQKIFRKFNELLESNMMTYDLSKPQLITELADVIKLVQEIIKESTDLEVDKINFLGELDAIRLVESLGYRFAKREYTDVVANATSQELTFAGVR